MRNSSIHFSVRQLSLVMLRRLLSNSPEENWNKLAEENKHALKQELLLAVQQEQDSGIRKKIADVIAELSRLLIDPNGHNTWPEVLQLLFDMSNSNNIALKEVGLNIFT